MKDTPEIYLAKSGKCKHSNSRYPDTAIAAWPTRSNTFRTSPLSGWGTRVLI